jgi:Na+/proline symporter/nitrogen-specific signal transduction histidine kinase
VSSWIIIGFSFGYLAILFLVAWYAENRSKAGKRLLANPYVYALSLAVYCSAWTYFGSVGRAAESGFEFMAIYIGPAVLAPLWWVILRKIIRICKVQRITTIADFISARYGKDLNLGMLVALFCVIGIVPYLALQLKALASSFEILEGNGSTTMKPWFWLDKSFYLAIGLAFFTILFGTRRVDTSEQHEGLVSAIAFESIVKLVAFLVAGVVIVYFLADGPIKLFEDAMKNPELSKLFVFEGGTSASSWFWLVFLSMMAILFLPRQFQVAVVENVNEKHLQKAIWVFPLYLLLINLFVMPIALAGKLQFGNSIDADTFILAIPMAAGMDALALFIYIGGFSAASGMIIVSSIALSTMLSNNVIHPLFIRSNRFKRFLGNNVLLIRRLSIALIILLAYAYHVSVSEYFPLVSIGLVSFAAVAQFTPAIIGGIFWKKGNRQGALYGLYAGFAIWFFTLVVPSMVSAQMLPVSIMEQGLFGISALRPFSLFGLEGMDYIGHSLFWSLLFNAGFYVWFSLSRPQSVIEHNQAEIFVDIFRYSTSLESSIVWKGTAYIPDIRSLLERFLGQNRTDQLLYMFSQKHQVNLDKMDLADAKLVNFAEKQLAGAIGSASARVMIASVTKEEEITMEEVVDILKESQQLMEVNKELRRKSDELKQATENLKKTNLKLKQLDELKDEFLSTVTHELRTPLTSIRALSELLSEYTDMEAEERGEFLHTITRETERMGRLIDQVLDLEKYESGKMKLTLSKLDVPTMVAEAVAPIKHLLREKDIQLSLDIQNTMPEMYGDKERLIQVLINLLGNALKYCDAEEGKIGLSAYYLDGQLKINVTDNGKGIPEESLPLIFDKFYQAKNQTLKKPRGSGLGLAICRNIIRLHEGRIWVENNPDKGTRFSFTIPANRY